MDPRDTLILALTGDKQAIRDYNEWVLRGGYAVRVDIAPNTDLYMRGVRHAEVRCVDRHSVTLREMTVRGRYTGKVSKEFVIVPEG